MRNCTRLLLSVAAVSTLFGAQAAAQHQGSFGPCDVRTPISKLPFTITEAGSYYVTRNLVGTRGITVEANDVTIDLNGFSIYGNANSSGSGIQTSLASGNRLTVVNGSIVYWPEWAIEIDNTSVRGQRIENIEILDCQAGGIRVQYDAHVEKCTVRTVGDGILASDRSTIVDCSVVGTTGAGIAVGAFSQIENCNSQGTGDSAFNAKAGNSVLRNCIAESAGNHGFLLGPYCRAEGCQTTSAGKRGFQMNDPGITLRDCTSILAGQEGFNIGENCILQGCMAIDSSEQGFEMTGSSCILRDCLDSGAGLEGFSLKTSASVAGCVSRDAGGSGFTAPSGAENLMLANCVASNATLHGFDMRPGATLTACSSGGNTTAGFVLRGAQASGCVARDNGTYGFYMDNAQLLQSAALFNGSDGIFMTNTGRAVGVYVASNSGSGIEMATAASLISDATVVANSNSNILITGDGNHVRHWTGTVNDQGNNNITTRDW